MRESQAEIKAIEAQLKSIRAESTQRTGSSSKSKRSAKSIAEPPSTTLRDPETQFNYPSQTAVLEKPPSTRKSKTSTKTSTKTTGTTSRSSRSSKNGSDNGLIDESAPESTSGATSSPTSGAVRSSPNPSSPSPSAHLSTSSPSTNLAATASQTASQRATQQAVPHPAAPSRPIAATSQTAQTPQTAVRLASVSGSVPAAVSMPASGHSNPTSTPTSASATHPPAQKRRIESYPLPQNSLPQNPLPQNPLPQNRQVPDQLTATVERLHQQSEFYIQQFKQIQARSLQTPDEILDQSFQVLEAHIQHINQLSAVQEAAILGLKAMAEKVEQDWKALELMSLNQANVGKPYTEADIDIPTICACAETAVPKVEKTKDGSYVLSSRSIDVYKAEREASLTAQALRHWTKQGNPHQNSNPYQKSTRSPSNRGLTWLVNFLTFAEPDSQVTNPAKNPVKNQTTHHPKRSARNRVRNHAKNHAKSQARAQISPHTAAPTASPTPTHPKSASTRVVRNRRASGRRAALPLFNWRQGVAVLLGAIFVRVVLDLILASFPILWTPAIALLVTPAAIAVYRTSHTPRSGIAWSYRLVLIMIGLFLGGRL